MNIKAFVEVNILFFLINFVLVLAIAVHSVILGVGLALVLALIYAFLFYQAQSNEVGKIDERTATEFMADNEVENLGVYHLFEIITNQLKESNEQYLIKKQAALIEKEELEGKRLAEATRIEAERQSALNAQSVAVTTNLGNDAVSVVVETNVNTDAVADEPFKIRKKGLVLNFILFLTGVIPLVVIILLVDEFLGLNISSSSSTFLFIMVVLVINFIYYMPTFLCYSPSKIFIFVLNVLVSWTVIGWVLLLMFAISSNRAYRYREEMLHFQRKVQ